MKRTVAFLISLIFLLAVSTAYAHPPSDIRITFDPNTKMLIAVIMHNTNNPLRHYIKKVEVSLNDKKIIGDNFSKQDNKISQTVIYSVLDAKDGDMIYVEGYCSISGKLKKEIVAK